MSRSHRLCAFARRLRRARSGVAAVEFALSLPFLVTAGLFGTELTWYMLTNMRVSQVALQVADNASRIGDTSTLTNRKIYEADINDLLVGAHLDGGNMLDLINNGRIVISSVEVNSTNKQYIHWQRCKGSKVAASAYGPQGTILPNAGIGPSGQEVSAETGDALIFVEVFYTYRPLVTKAFVKDVNLKAIASYGVRDNRDLSQIYQTTPAVVASTC